MVQTDIFSSTSSATLPLHSAGYSTLNYLPLNNRLPVMQSLVDCNRIALSALHPGHLVCIKLLLMYSMRSVELLRLRVGDMLSPTVFFVNGAKNSHSYQITIPFSSLELNALVALGERYVIFPFSYQSIWRSMTKAGLTWSRAGRCVQVVTHKGRYLLADKLAKLNKHSSVQGCLHHKSARSKDYYFSKLFNETKRSYRFIKKGDFLDGD